MSNESSPLISVIIPVYKVEPYLKRCVDSVLNQTYTNLEIILVDDGSPDLCPKMCDEYAVLDSRVKVVHKKNGGQSSARNAGLDICKGSFVSFIDSDDFITDCFIEHLYRGILEENSDIAMCGFQTFRNVCEINGLNCLFSVQPKSPKDILSMYSSPYPSVSMLATVVWNKLFRKSLFDAIRFPEGKVYEDAATSYKIYFSCGKIALINEKLYYYSLRDDSTTGGCKFSERYLDFFIALNDAKEWFEMREQQEIACFFIPQILMSGLYAWWGMKYVLKRPEKSKELLFFLRSRSWNMEPTRYFSKAQRLCLLTLLKIPLLYVVYRKITSGYIGKRC